VRKSKTDWELIHAEEGLTLVRTETPIALWLLDRWFRIPDAISDWIEWRLPATAPVTRVPCLLYSRWYPELVVRRTWTDYRVVEAPESDRAEDVPGSD
jgi:hypothetical protein